MNPVLPAARWSPAIHSRRPFIGQPFVGILTVLVQKDGIPVSGVPIEVMFANGEASNGVTDNGGSLAVSYTSAQKGQAIVRIMPPEGVEDIGEGSAQGVDLKGGPAEAKFDLVGIGGSPFVGIGIVGVLYSLVLGLV